MNRIDSYNISNVIESLRNDSNFTGKDSLYASHNFHAFAAKFPPQLPRLFIENLTSKGEIVLDPMVGSGTTIVEALLLGRQGIGFDIDPLAIHLAKIKTSAIHYEKIHNEINRVLKKALDNLQDNKLIEDQFQARFDKKTMDFINYWFHIKTQKELMSLLLSIEEVISNEVREFFKLIFSSIIITKSGGVSLARDLAHSRPHKDLAKIPKNAIEAFSARLTKMLPGLEKLPQNSKLIRVEQCDVKKIALNDNYVDLIVTSPPYANAIDYMRAHKFSLVWLGKSISELSLHRAKYIGSERIGNAINSNLPESCLKTIYEVEKLDGKKAKILNKYFCEMSIVIKEMKRVLKHGKYCIMVVGNSTMRGYHVKSNKDIENISKNIGFEVIDNIKRKLDRNKRMMPVSFFRNNTGIEQRMHEEFIIVLRKP